MENRFRLEDKQRYVPARSPVVIDLLEDTPPPSSKPSRVKPKPRADARVVLLDDSDELSETDTKRRKNAAQDGPRDLLKGNISPWSKKCCDTKRSYMGDSRSSYDGATGGTRKTQTARDSDSIIFTPPADQPLFPGRLERMRKSLSPLSDEFGDIDVALRLSQQTNSLESHARTNTILSDRTAKLLNGLRGQMLDGRKDEPKTRTGNMVAGLPLVQQADRGHTTNESSCSSASRKRKVDECGGRDSVTEDPSVSHKKPAKTKLTLEEKEEQAKEKERERERKRIEKEVEKIIERGIRQKLKERKAQEKELASQLASANRLKLDKKVSSLEMIVDLPASLQRTPLGEQLESLLRNIQVEPVYTSDCPIPNLVRWRRKTTAKFNDELGHWEPIPIEIKTEKHIMCILPAKEFVEMTQADSNEIGRKDIDTHVLRIKSRFEGCRPIYLIEGLNVWMRKNKNVRNRKFQAAVVSQGGLDTGTKQYTSRTGARKPTQEYIDEDLIEDALLRLQVVHHCLTHHTAVLVETAEWVANFTQHISTIPYRSQRMDLEASFCMESGQVKTGEGKNDTYVRMLQEIVRVTAPVAYGIAAEYPDLPSLLIGLRQSGPTVLQDLKKTANKNGAFTNNNIGPAISKRVHKIFMGTDPTSTEI